MRLTTHSVRKCSFDKALNQKWRLITLMATSQRAFWPIAFKHSPTVWGGATGGRRGGPMRGRYPGNVITLNPWEASSSPIRLRPRWGEEDKYFHCCVGTSSQLSHNACSQEKSIRRLQGLRRPTVLRIRLYVCDHQHLWWQHLGRWHLEWWHFGLWHLGWQHLGWWHLG